MSKNLHVKVDLDVEVEKTVLRNGFLPNVFVSIN